MFNYSLKKINSKKTVTKQSKISSYSSETNSVLENYASGHQDKEENKDKRGGDGDGDDEISISFDTSDELGVEEKRVVKISSSGALVEDKTVTISLSSTSETLEINCVVTSFWFDSLEVAIEDKVVWNSADDWDAGDWVVGGWVIGGWDVGGKYLVVSNSLLTWSWNSFVDEIGKEVVILSSDVSWETFWTDDKVVWWVWFS